MSKYTNLVIDSTTKFWSNRQATDNGPEMLLPQDMSWLFRLPQYIEAYFENFHPNLPALHQPTFDMSTTKLPLLQAIACIGSVCHSRDTDHRIGVALFDAGCKSLDEYVSFLHVNPTFKKIELDNTWSQD